MVLDVFTLCGFAAAGFGPRSLMSYLQLEARGRVSRKSADRLYYVRSNAFGLRRNR